MLVNIHFKEPLIKKLKKILNFAAGQTKSCYVKIENIKNSALLLNGEAASYKCYFCNKTYTNFPLLNNHLKKNHPKKSFFNCDFVACLHLFFSSEVEKNKHMKEQHSSSSDRPKISRCIYCDKVYLCSNVLKTHVWYVHQNISIRCNYINCNKFLKNEADRDLHVQEEHGKNHHQCVYCEKVGESRNSLRMHVHNQHRKMIVKCNYSKCTEYLKSEADRPKHMEEKHAARENVYCDKWMQACNCEW
jgi:hypothetical protein